MASITIRNLEDGVKAALREQAAKNGRSMEEEARLLLAGLGSGAHKTPIAINEIIQKPVSSFEQSLDGKSILLIITGGIAAYKALDLIRRLKERGAKVRAIMTAGAQEFITPLTVGALTGEKVFLDLFSKEDEHDIGHIRLAREADLIVVAPCTANFMAKLAGGIADDLAGTVMLAAHGKRLLAPAMNPKMWENPATQRNVAQLKSDGLLIAEPDSGEMAESGEAGKGRLKEIMALVAEIEDILDETPQLLAGKRAVITSGPTHEAIDPVRYIANRSSGKQGHAIAAVLAKLGAEVILISGPTRLEDPRDVNVVRVKSAREMQKAVEIASPIDKPADICIFAAAVADWRVKNAADEKMKKANGYDKPTLEMVENPDILKGIGRRKKGRPPLVIGFAAETQDVIKYGRDKLKRKGADWILANDVSPQTGTFGGDNNAIKFITQEGVEEWPQMKKTDVAKRLADEVVGFFAKEGVEI